jgi:hypothetical protein
MMKMNSKLLSGCLLFAVLSFSSDSISNSLTSNISAELPKQDQITKESWSYKNWTRVNTKPVKMESGIAAMCAPALPTRKSSPHDDKFIVVYVNEIGRNAMLTEKNPQFPQGSAIVKEKLSSAKSTSPELLTAMIKREKGFNPSGNDWEFFVLSGDAKSIQAHGKLDNCLACHTAKRSNDFVFRNYLSEDVLMRLKD